MQKPVVVESPLVAENREKLVRLRATRRGVPVDLRVHYEICRENGCDTFRILSVDDVD